MRRKSSYSFIISLSLKSYAEELGLKYTNGHYTKALNSLFDIIIGSSIYLFRDVTNEGRGQPRNVSAKQTDFTFFILYIQHKKDVRCTFANSVCRNV